MSVCNICQQTKKIKKDGSILYLPKSHHWLRVTESELILTGMQFVRKMYYIYLRISAENIEKLTTESTLMSAKQNQTNLNVVNPL